MIFIVTRIVTISSQYRHKHHKMSTKLPKNITTWFYDYFEMFVTIVTRMCVTKHHKIKIKHHNIITRENLVTHHSVTRPSQSSQYRHKKIYILFSRWFCGNDDYFERSWFLFNMFPEENFEKTTRVQMYLSIWNCNYFFLCESPLNFNKNIFDIKARSHSCVF